MTGPTHAAVRERARRAPNGGRTMAKRDDASASGKSRAGAVIDTVTDVVVDAKGAVTPLSKGAAKELRRLEKRLTAARKTESKRLRQLAAALASNGRKQITKRRKQAAAAEADVAGLAARIAGLAGSAAGSAAGTAGAAARGVGSAAAQAAQAVTPVRAPKTTGTSPTSATTSAAAAKRARKPRTATPRRRTS